MCGRTSLVHASADEIAEAFGLVDVPPLVPRYNIAPTQLIPIVIAAAGTGTGTGTERAKREMHLSRFGLLPFWDKAGGGKHINARAETIFTKRPFAEPIRKRRCLVVVDGFYEWKRAPGPTKGRAKAPNEPYRIHFAGDQPFALAGVWESWSTQGGEVVETCAIITGPSKGSVIALHDREPLVVPRDDYGAWLSAETDPRAMLERFVATSPAWVIDKASRYVNDPRHEGPECWDPSRDPETKRETLSLFQKDGG